MRHVIRQTGFLAVAVGATLLLAVGSRAHAATLDVGPGQPYPTLGSVQWDHLQPGDTVNIHWQPQPYREMILLSQSGTAAQHIVVRGIADPVTGQLPVIDGQNAVQSPTLKYRDNASSSPVLYKLGVVMVSPAQGMPYGYVPKWIDIENLEIRGASSQYAFTAGNGQVTQYHTFASAIYTEFAQHLTIRNCSLHDSGNGLFVNSKTGSGISTDLLVDGNTIYGNGVAGDSHEHNIYTEALGTTFQYNFIGPLRAGATGAALKDRSAGTVIRYNWIEGGSHNLDLVETQGGQGVLNLDPRYKETFVYGNVIYNGAQGATTMIHYGGDQYAYAYYRRGTLHFYHNTLINQADQSGTPSRYYTIVFSLPTQAEAGGTAIDEVVDAQNNVFYRLANTPGAAPGDLELLGTDAAGTLNLGTNWISPGYHAYHQPWNAPFLGQVSGVAGLVVGDQNGKNNAGFVDFANRDLHLLPSSATVDRAAVLVGIDPTQAVAREWMFPTYGIDRITVGNGPDLGAFECQTLPNPPALAGFTPGSGGAGATVTLAGTSLLGSSVVSFNGAKAVFNVISDTQLQAIVPAGATTGPITVTAPGGSAITASAFVVVPPVKLTALTPGSGSVGTAVVLSGSGFTGATSVKFNGVSASFTLVNDTTIQTTVPAGATTGLVQVTAPGGIASSASAFVVTTSTTSTPPASSAPVISQLAPPAGPVGTTVYIYGTNFSGATAVRFNGVPAVFRVLSGTMIQTIVPAGATTGPVLVNSPAGYGASPAPFKVTTGN